MNRLLQYFNFVGVLALAVLCASQWQTNSRINQEADRLEASRQDQAAKIAEQDKTIKGNAADLDDLRKRLATAEAAAKETEAKLAAANSERAQAIAARDQWKSAIDTRWVPAIAQRDEVIRQQKDDLQKIDAVRVDAINRFNELTNKYNALVQEMNNRTKATGHG